MTPSDIEQRRDDIAPERVTTTEARQAVEPNRVRYMLVFGLAAVIAAFAVIYLAFVVW